MLLGVDVGTSSCKALAFDPYTRRTLGRGHSTYRIIQPQPGWLELNPDEVWLGVLASIRQALDQSGCTHVDGLAVVSAGLAVLPVAMDGKPLSNFVLPADGRAVREARDLANALGEDYIYATTGLASHSLYGLPKLMWLSRYRPDVFKQSHRFLSLDTFVHSRMGLEPTFDPAMACRTLALDCHTREWSQPLLDAAQVGHEVFPLLGVAGDTLGTVSKSTFEGLGLDSDVTAYVGCHDQAAASLGAGGLQEGVLTASLGTMESLCVAFDEPVLRESLMRSHLFLYPHACPRWFWTLAMLPGIGCIPEFVSSCIAGGDGFLKRLLEAGQGYQSTPSPAFLVPYLVGSATPSLNPHMRGAIWGLTIGTSARDLVQGALEGACFEVRRNLELLRKEGFHWREIRATGGNSRWAGWIKMRADITGWSWGMMSEKEASALGAIMLAGLGSGVFRSEEEAWSICGEPCATVDPDPSIHERYEDSYRKYELVASLMESASHSF